MSPRTAGITKEASRVAYEEINCRRKLTGDRIINETNTRNQHSSDLVIAQAESNSPPIHPSIRVLELLRRTSSSDIRIAAEFLERRPMKENREAREIYPNDVALPMLWELQSRQRRNPIQSRQRCNPPHKHHPLLPLLTAISVKGYRASN